MPALIWESDVVVAIHVASEWCLKCGKAVKQLGSPGELFDWYFAIQSLCLRENGMDLERCVGLLEVQTGAKINIFSYDHTTEE